MVLRAPILPEETRYLPSNALAQAGEFGNIPFVKLRIRIETETSGQRYIAVTAVSILRIPDDIDEGGSSQDPYVKVGLEPWCAGFHHSDPIGGTTGNYNEEIRANGITEGNPVRTNTAWSGGTNVHFSDNGFKMRIPFPHRHHARYAKYAKLRVGK